jgi:nitrite reductase (cytochrome c-552)
MSQSPQPTPGPSNARRNILYAVIVLLMAVATVAVLLLLENVMSRTVVKLDESVVDPAEWGKNYPRQYDSYQRTVDTERTRHGGSEAFQRLDEYPVWRDLFAGYAFGIDYREDRGHAYMLSDQRETERVHIVKQPGACLHCHASVTTAYREVGLEAGSPGKLTDPLDSPEGRAQLMKGFEEVCAMPYDKATSLVEHPVTCLDCHDPNTMQLRVTRPAFVLGIQRVAESDDPLPHLPSVERWRKGDRKKPYDPNSMATRQEMRSMSCAQCHVEYYFKGEGKLLTYPWHKGLKMDQAEAYYNEVGFTDWTHKITKAPMLRPSIRSLSCGARACTPVRACRAPTATCPTSAKARSRSATTTSAARC